MPSTTGKQKRTMAAAAHDAAFAKKVGIPQSVAKEFNAADQRQSRVKVALAAGKSSVTRRRNKG
jgi:hypothetical protein